MIKYPHIKVKLVGNDGNAFMVLGLVKKAMHKAKLSEKEIDDYIAEAASDDYDHLLRVTMQTVNVC